MKMPTIDILKQLATEQFDSGKRLKDCGCHLEAYGQLCSSSALFSAILQSKDLPEGEFAGFSEILEDVREINQLQSLIETHFEQMEMSLNETKFHSGEHLEELLKLGEDHHIIAKSFLENGSFIKAYGKLSSSSALLCAALYTKDLDDAEKIKIEGDIRKMIHRKCKIEEGFQKSDTDKEDKGVSDLEKKLEEKEAELQTALADVTSMKAQSLSLTKEYDRLMEEKDKVELRLRVLDTGADGDKKDD